MIKIGIKTVSLIDKELLDKGIKYNSFPRLFVEIEFTTMENKLFTRKFVVDTGAIISILPHYIWKRLQVDIIGEHYVKGLNKEDSAAVPVKIGILTARLVDNEGNESKPFRMPVYGALTDKVPCIFGLKNALERFNLVAKFPENKAWLEEIQ